ncbi:hypothetical protein ACFSUK_20985 [Sphingobium scionense]
MTLYHAYERARDDNLDAVRRAGNGSRNNTLNRAAYATAQLAKAAGFEMVAEKRKLIEAAKACGLDEREAYGRWIVPGKMARPIRGRSATIIPDTTFSLAMQCG